MVPLKMGAFALALAAAMGVQASAQEIEVENNAEPSYLSEADVGATTADTELAGFDPVYEAEPTDIDTFEVTADNALFEEPRAIEWVEFDDGGLEIYPSMAPTDADFMADEPVVTLVLTDASEEFEAGGSEIYPSVAPASTDVNIPPQTGDLVVAEITPSKTPNTRTRKRDVVTAAVSTGNACTDPRTYVAFLCSWQGFERP